MLHPEGPLRDQCESVLSSSGCVLGVSDITVPLSGDHSLHDSDYGSDRPRAFEHQEPPLPAFEREKGEHRRAECIEDQVGPGLGADFADLSEQVCGQDEEGADDLCRASQQGDPPPNSAMAHTRSSLTEGAIDRRSSYGSTSGRLPG